MARFLFSKTIPILLAYPIKTHDPTLLHFVSLYNRTYSSLSLVFLVQIVRLEQAA